MFLQIFFHFLPDFHIVGTLRIQPENCRHLGSPGAIHGKLYPIANRSVFRLAHPENIALFHLLRKQNFAFAIDGVNLACSRSNKRFVAASVFLGTLRHQTHILNRPHRTGVECSILFAKFNGRVINSRIAAIRNAGFDLLQFAILIPHTARVADHRGHGSVDNHVARHMQIRNPLGGIDHRQIRSLRQSRIDCRLDFFFPRISRKAFVKIAQSIVRIDAQFLE